MGPCKGGLRLQPGHAEADLHEFGRERLVAPVDMVSPVSPMCLLASDGG